MQRQKTRGELYDQMQRIRAAQVKRAYRRAKTADPDTGGSPHLTHNWGNAEAKAAWAEESRDGNKVHAVFYRLYAEAEHRTHGPRFRPLWCESCQQRT